MVDLSARLKLPLIAAAQAQKHVTHNEALSLLDAIVQLSVVAFDAATPPVAPDDGAVYALGAAPTGAWAGQTGKLALASSGGWQFVTPMEGWRAASGSDLRVWDGLAWVRPDLPDLQNLAGVGIGTSYSVGNPLSVAGEATLLTHSGAGHQVKVNKAAPGDTASLLFQTGWSGRAEMGTAGSDNFAIKVSADGSTWTTALSAAAGDGKVAFGSTVSVPEGSAVAPGLAIVGKPDTGLFSPLASGLGFSTGGVQRAWVHDGGLEVAGAITGTAVTQSASDGTAGRLLRVGDGGLLGTAISFGPGQNFFDADKTQFIGAPSLSSGAPADKPANESYAGMHVRASSTRWGQLLISLTTGVPRTWVRAFNSTVGAWDMLFSRGTAVGTVSQTAGVPTGALIERGSNANGEYLRLADGTQFCWHTLTASAASATSWTFPAVFSVAPRVTGSAIATVLAAFCLDATPTTTSASVSIRDKTDARRADALRLIAIGRWY